jgi:hypothetical protein
MTEYLPPLSSASEISLLAGSLPPSPAKSVDTQQNVSPRQQKLVAQPKRRKSYGDELQMLLIKERDSRHRSLPVVVSDLFNPL